jgi:hypothetical protein
MANLGKSHILIMWTVGAEHEAEADRIFGSHAQWMEGHPKEGDEALISYSISKGPELANPMDPGSEPTGNLIYVLDEIYESPAGVPRHWQDAIDNWGDLGAIMELSKSGTVQTLHSGTVVQSLW